MPTYVRMVKQLNVTGGAMQGPDNSGDWLLGKIYEVEPNIARWLVANEWAEYYGPVTDARALPDIYAPPPLEAVPITPPERLHVSGKRNQPTKEDN